MDVLQPVQLNLNVLSRAQTIREIKVLVDLVARCLLLKMLIDQKIIDLVLDSKELGPRSGRDLLSPQTTSIFFLTYSLKMENKSSKLVQMPKVCSFRIKDLPIFVLTFTRPLICLYHHNGRKALREPQSNVYRTIKIEKPTMVNQA